MNTNTQAAPEQDTAFNYNSCLCTKIPQTIPVRISPFLYHRTVLFTTRRRGCHTEAARLLTLLKTLGGEHKKMNMKEKITNLREDKRGVSPVIGVIMMIAIVVIIAAVVAAFAYGIIGGVNKAPSTALVVEGVRADDYVLVKVFHHGGDSITEAFAETAAPDTDFGAKWGNIVVKLNGATLTGTTADIANSTMAGLTMNNTKYDESWKKHFQSGDIIEMNITKLESDDSLVIIHAPSDSILQRVTVM